MWIVRAEIHLSHILVFPDSIFMKLALAQLSVKNSYTEIYKNPTKGLVADTRHIETEGRTGEKRWSPYKIFLLLYYANVTHKREDIQLQ
jgi:hypothetical protein